MRVVLAVISVARFVVATTTYDNVTTTITISLTTTPSSLTVLGNKSIDFVNVIKEVLRRNNDDYADLSRNWSRRWSPVTYTVARSPPPRARTPDHFYYTKRNSFLLNKIVDRNARRYLLPSMSVDTTTSQRSRTKHVKQLNAIQADKIRQLISKHRAKTDEETGEGRMRALHSADNRDPDYRALSLPDEEQLDMAPAKGGRIHAMRHKGRLCQRSVLFPEGPKYDSKGKIYLPAYTPYRGHQFPETRPPELILPRCCNCCKKSVLGCE